jgi:hypothetical protein
MLRVSCSEKPADRSPSRLCRRTGAPRRLVRYDNIHLDSSILTLVLLISILSSNTFTPYPPILLMSTLRRLTDRYTFSSPLFTTLFLLQSSFHPQNKKKKKVFHNLPSFWPLFKMRQSMRVGRVSLWNSLSLLWFALSFSKAIFQSQERVKRRMKLFHVIFEYVIVVP